MATAADNAYTAIRKMLGKNQLTPGSRVSQSKLARQLGCSAMPVLEAMRRLESDGLLVKEPRKMAKVRQLTDRDIEGLYLVREGLESVAARMAANNVTEEQARHLIQLNDDYESFADAHDYETCKNLEVSIHKYIAQVADCPLLTEELNRLLLIERTAARSAEPSKPLEQFRIEHRAVIQAIVDRDGDSAEYLMKKHIQNRR